MGWDIVADIVGDIGKKVVDTAIGGTANFLGKQAEDKYIGDPNSAEAYRRQKEFYRNRYQWMMNDMQKAGLNPILAAGSAGFSTSGTPSVQQSAMPTSDYTASARNIAEIGKIHEETKTQQVEQIKKMAEVKTEIERKYEVRANAGLVGETERSIWFTIEKLHSETIRNMKEGFKTEAEQKLLESQLRKLAVELTRLKNVNTIYSNPASMALSIIREIANSIGLSVGVVAPVK